MSDANEAREPGLTAACFPGIGRSPLPRGFEKRGSGDCGPGDGWPPPRRWQACDARGPTRRNQDQVLRFLSGASSSIGLGDLWVGRRSSAKLAEVLPENVRTARGCNGTQGSPRALAPGSHRGQTTAPPKDHAQLGPSVLSGMHWRRGLGTGPCGQSSLRRRWAAVSRDWTRGSLAFTRNQKRKKPLGRLAPVSSRLGFLGATLTTVQELRADVRQARRAFNHLGSRLHAAPGAVPGELQTPSPDRARELVRRNLVPNSIGEFLVNQDAERALHAPRYPFGTSEAGRPQVDRGAGASSFGNPMVLVHGLSSGHEQLVYIFLDPAALC